MEKPLFTLGAKEFLSGVSGSDHSGRGGLFSIALGVSPIRNIGSFNESNTGLLQTSPTGEFGGTSVIVDTPIAGAHAIDTAGTDNYLYVVGSLGHVYKKNQASAAPTDLRNNTGGNPDVISNVANGIAIFEPRGGTRLLYVWRKQNIATYNITTDTWSDSAYSGLENVTMHPTHSFIDYVFYGNDYKIGRLSDDGASGVTHSTNVLDFPSNMQVFALEDDGVYLIASISDNKQSVNAVGDSRIIFWDTFSSSWQREYRVRDNIVDLKRIGSVVYGIGTRGIYQISFGGGVQKVWSIGASVLSGSGRLIGPGLLSSFNDALVAACQTSVVTGSVSTLGQASPMLPFAYHQPIATDSGNNPSFVDSEFSPGYFVVGDSSPAMKFYNINGTTNATSKSAETVYISFGTRYQINRIDVVLGEPMASGDSLNIDVQSDEDTAAVDWGTASFASQGAVRRVSLYSNTPFEGDYMKIILNYNGGAVKLKRLEVYGQAMTP